MDRPKFAYLGHSTEQVMIAKPHYLVGANFQLLPVIFLSTFNNARTERLQSFTPDTTAAEV